MAKEYFLEERRIPDLAPVKVAHDVGPAVDHLPALLIQPASTPPDSTRRYPLPVKGVGGAVSLDFAVDVIFLGRYCRLAGQSDELPTVHTVSHNV